MTKKFLLRCGVLLSLSGLTFAGAITTSGELAGTQLDVIGITGFATTGADMGGLSVTAVFAESGSQNCIWAATVGTSGGCGVAGLFEIEETGDTFSNEWTLRNISTFDRLLTLILDGTPGRFSDSGVVFDRDFDDGDQGFGTEGSFLGADATGTTSDASTGDAVYSNVVALLPGAVPVGDVFTTLTISFNGLSNGATATFLADTDTIGIFNDIPEPGSVTLFMLGLAGLALGRRYTRS